eukprot:TRINITY_DN8160_c0_g1_i2.p1 TRINITY_DN8160_c0_g1~~TRINITY_DN8160_c0_g1_i2.p1  ORF type:complete len:165 (+),score=26.92 TRINITY_DN8160_c0_g1_i2:28-495(+)
MSSVDARLQELGLALPEPAAPLYSYVPTIITGNTLYLSGQVSRKPDGSFHTGKVGAGHLSIEEGQEAARSCVMTGLSQIKASIGNLDKVVRVVKVVGFVNAAQGFTDMPKVINGASDLLVSIFGEKGKHARSAVGVAELPLNVAVEIEMIVEIAV